MNAHRNKRVLKASTHPNPPRARGIKLPGISIAVAGSCKRLMGGKGAQVKLRISIGKNERTLFVSEGTRENVRVEKHILHLVIKGMDSQTCTARIAVYSSLVRKLGAYCELSANAERDWLYVGVAPEGEEKGRIFNLPGPAFA